MVWEPTVVEVEGRFAAASNITLLGTTGDGEKVVYKPVAGERALWDFPDGTLARREVLTYRLSEMLGLGIVPETVLGEGVHGPGSVQRFVDVDTGFDALTLLRGDVASLWPVAVLDILANNADRKMGHMLHSRSGGLVAIDHGLTFHVDDKLRTVLWVLAGESLPAELQLAVDHLAGDPAPMVADIGDLLGVAEAESFGARLATLAASLRHPVPPQDRPPLPWPLY